MIEVEIILQVISDQGVDNLRMELADPAEVDIAEVDKVHTDEMHNATVEVHTEVRL